MSLIIAQLNLSSASHAASGDAYMKRFMAYSAWSQALPDKPEADFLAFISEDAPLSHKLREKWLYQLAQKKDWPLFLLYYKPSTDTNLQCMAYLATYYNGQTDAAMNGAKSLWLTGDTLPAACNTLFDIFIQSARHDQFISARITTALLKRNMSLVKSLFTKYPRPRTNDAEIAASIDTNPSRIVHLKSSDLRDALYLYGLKRMVAMHQDKAFDLWARPLTKLILSPAQQQTFVAHVALYKAMRHEDDANVWFSAIKPAYYSEPLIEWQIRLALKDKHWATVKQLIERIKLPDKTPVWNYWLARANEALGNKDQAREQYHKLAATRHYYGFLASLRLHQPFTFQNENTSSNTAKLKPYQPILQMTKQYYNSNQFSQASRLLTDFSSELTIDDKSALIAWIANELHWYSKSVYLSNTDALTNRLSLRFPLPYQASINNCAKKTALSPALIYAIIRQESGFREDVISPAGARGLMQVMPATAKLVAKKERMSYQHHDELFMSDKNIRIGCAYLNQLIKRYDHILFVAAAYNAGPHQLNYWLKNIPTDDMDIWIETLPWYETRNYLKNIVSFYTVYQYRLHHKSNLSEVMRMISTS